MDPVTLLCLLADAATAATQEATEVAGSLNRDTLVLTHAAVLPMTRDTLLSDQTIVITGGVIVAAGTEFEAHVHEKRQEFRESGLEGLSLDYAVDLLGEIYGLAVQGEQLAATDRIVAPYLDEPWYHTAFGDGPISDRHRRPRGRSAFVPDSWSRWLAAPC